jgi:hypothetical protein
MIVNFYLFLLMKDLHPNFKFREINSLNKNSCRDVLYLVSVDVFSIISYLLDSYMIHNQAKSTCVYL